MRENLWNNDRVWNGAKSAGGEKDVVWPVKNNEGEEEGSFDCHGSPS